MKTIISPDGQLTATPLNSNIKEELEKREGNKDYVYNLTPFVRVSCLQEVSYTDETDDSKGNSLKDVKGSVLTDRSTFNGFQFVFESDFEESYGIVQKIGKTLDNEDVRIKNPRRVPPPSLDNFTAQVGQSSGFFTTAQLSFTCNSLEQLQFLTPFLFNPGNTIFVEFGHNSDKLKNINLFGEDDANKLINSVVTEYDCGSNDDESFVEMLNNRVFETGGSYEYFYGIIKNFDFSVNDSLGFDCTVDLISSVKMKMQAPNVNNYNNGSGNGDKLSILTLNSQVKTFVQKLEDRGSDRELNPIFELSGTKYVRLKNIFGFLNGDYDSYSIEQFEEQQSVRSAIDDSGVSLGTSDDDLRNKKIETIIGHPEKTLVKKENIESGVPPVVSYSDDVLLFRKKMWTPIYSFDNDSGVYALYKTSDELNFVDGTVYLDDLSISRDAVAESVSTSTRTTTIVNKERVTVSSKTVRPYLMDIEGEEEFENLSNAYIKLDKFRNIYVSSGGRILDTFKKLIDLINDATDDLWELEMIGDAEERSSDGDTDNDCNRNITGIGSLSSLTVDDRNTYTFKANSKNSVFTSMDYSLGLDGLLGDQIFMNSINSSDGSLDSQKLNLLLFSNHENNLNIIDKRNDKIRSVSEDLRKQNNNLFVGEGSGNEDNDDDESVNKNYVHIDTKNELFGKYIIRNPNSRSNLSSNKSERLLGDIGRSRPSSPFSGKMENIEFFNLSTDTDGKPKYNLKDIFRTFTDVYNMNRIPLIFTPLKEAISALRANTSNNVKFTGQGSDEEDGTDRSRSFRTGGINPLLESELSVTLPGIGGINPLEVVKVSGIPDVYSERGNFTIMNVSHTITPTSWETQLTSRFRPTYENE